MLTSFLDFKTGESVYLAASEDGDALFVCPTLDGPSVVQRISCEQLERGRFVDASMFDDLKIQ